MAQRWLLAATLIAGLAISGCSSGSKTTTPSGSTTKNSTSASATSSSSSSETTEAAPTTTLDISQCVDVTGANADLLTASDNAGARKAADTLEKYNPPAKVKDAIEHFVTTGGAHFDDPDYTKNNKLVSDWVKGVCPT
ncbi:hypothetical protein BN1232_02903 [Mycobacterium lentiflavum]|uniref:DUF732 domain-containing protein n=1 Tax=Mycobacterium lentiflavum TaxID=141349 RepID=A0A0E4GXW7_MYCLN|nr:hypothetical protein [Mycobacterium lentiflavum]MEE3065375.1 hypothetical protein [Actinomycetota bacterium]ULP44833.1 hypothetical protein MJO58_13510 [Mycobacterium lentiflavum]CQD14074.1 hypothetical protein BN1232_02903 [Mycobacterium lentiflavum]